MKKRLIFFLFSLLSMINENPEEGILNSKTNSIISNNDSFDNITGIRSITMPHSKKVSHNGLLSNDSFDMAANTYKSDNTVLALTKNNISAIDRQYEISMTTTNNIIYNDNNNQTSRNCKKKTIAINNDSDVNSDIEIINEQMNNCRYSYTNTGRAINNTHNTQEDNARTNDPGTRANDLESGINEMQQGSQDNKINLLANSEDIILTRLTKKNTNGDANNNNLNINRHDMMTYQHKIQKVNLNFAYNNFENPKAEIGFHHPYINILLNYDFNESFILSGDGFITITKEIILNIGILTNFDNGNLIKTNIEFTNIKYLDKITGGIIYDHEQGFNLSNSINIIMHKYLSVYSFSIYGQIGLWCTRPVLKIEITLIEYKKICISFSYLFAYDYTDKKFTNIPRILFNFVN